MSTIVKSIAAGAAALAMTASAAMAQETTTQSVVGQSGNAIYSVEVIGANGVRYHCLPNTSVVDGTNVRRCIRANAGAGLGNTPMGAGAAAIAGVLLLVAVAAANDT